MIHSCTGVTVTVAAGRRQTIPAFRRSQILTFPPPLGPVRVYDIGHAELATIPRFLPTVRQVRTQGAIAPAVLNGVFQGLGAAMASGRLSWEEAVQFALAIQADQRPSLSGGRAALRGVARQLGRGELGRQGLADAVSLARGEHIGVGGLYVRVDGQSDGRAAGWLSRAAMAQTANGGGMDQVTGSPLAIMAHLMLDGRVRHPGVVAPEAAVDTVDFVPLLNRVGMAETVRMFDPEPVPADR